MATTSAASERRHGPAGSTGFRAPTFNEAVLPGYGQTQIRPETSRNLEASLHVIRMAAARPG